MVNQIRTTFGAHLEHFCVCAIGSAKAERNMTSRLLLTTAVVLAFAVPALGQGAAGGAGSAASSGATGGTGTAGATSADTVGTGAGTPSSATGGTQERGRNVQQSNTARAVQQQREAATTGSNTAPSQPGDGAVSAPNVGVGHAANGLPIGAPGSGLGSPENSVGSTAVGPDSPNRR